MEPSSDKTPVIPSGEIPEATSFSSIRESLSEENALHIQSMQQGYRRNYRQNPDMQQNSQKDSAPSQPPLSTQIPRQVSPQNSCQVPPQNSCQNQAQNSCQNQAQNSCQNQAQNSCQNPAQNSCQNQAQNSCQNPAQNSCQNQAQNSCQNQAQNSCQNQAQNSCQNPAQSSCQNQAQNSCQSSMHNSCPPVPEPQPYAAYQAAMPYPLICPQGKNMQYAAAMLDNMSGQISEMSSLSFYFYNNLITAEYRELAEVFHHISIVEMHHLEIFGKLAMKLGENPRLWCRRGRNGGYAYWSPGYLKYPAFPVPSPSPKEQSGCCPPAACTALKSILSQSIDGEKEAIRKYMQQTTWIQDINVCDNLRRIAADEQVHVEIFTRLYHKY